MYRKVCNHCGKGNNSAHFHRPWICEYCGEEIEETEEEKNIIC